MSFDERVDLVDLILKVLKDHEKNLDTLVSQLGETLTQSAASGAAQAQGYNRHKLILRKWLDFRERCIKSDLVAFDMIDDKFHVSVMKNGCFYTYSEIIPEVTIKMEKDGDKILIEGREYMSDEATCVYNGKLQCGLSVNTRKNKLSMPNGDTIHKIIYNIDPDEAKIWLSDQLKTEKKSIVYGIIEP